ncbi:Short-chain dehydrogenase reductase SDR protein [Rutstroemia sp. NJR-2017a WRK4]|nr:Short-chain dehydrogenase reductase SDR protein [Rutstroemia sp. NJR-2017a WRK4]
MSKIVLILGAGPNIGLNLARVFSSNSYKTIVVSRTAKEELTKSADLAIQADFSDPKSIKSIFDEAKQKIGVPNVVIYNVSNLPPAAAASDRDDPFSLPLGKFISDTNVILVSGFAAIQESIAGFRTLPENTLKTFIYTGNILNRTIYPTLITFGAAKTAVAHMIEGASGVYAKEGFRFYWADERAPNGAAAGRGIDGKAHADFYHELASSEETKTWDATFVKGKGYVDFGGKAGPRAT